MYLEALASKYPTPWSAQIFMIGQKKLQSIDLLSKKVRTSLIRKAGHFLNTVFAIPRKINGKGGSNQGC
jgi:hypothetical protein